MHNFEKKYTIHNVHEEKVDTNTVIPVRARNVITSRKDANVKTYDVTTKRLSMAKMPSIATLSMDYSNK